MVQGVNLAPTLFTHRHMVAGPKIVSLVPATVALRSVRHALLNEGGVVDRDPLLQMPHLI